MFLNLKKAFSYEILRRKAGVSDINCRRAPPIFHFSSSAGRMAFYINQKASAIIEYITLLAYFIIEYGVVAVTLILFIIFVPMFCCCGCMSKKCRRFQEKMANIVQKIFFFLKKDGDRFIVYGYKAPICYTYFLFFMFFVLSVHCICTFWVGTASNNAELEQLRESDPTYLRRNCYALHDGDAVKLDTAINETCIEIRLLDGLQAASLTFGLSAIAVSFLTYTLLRMTKGNQIKKKRSCQRFCCVVSAVIIQIFLLITPRVIIQFYAAYFTDLDDDIDHPLGGVIDENSAFSTIAIFDAISLTMLTSWLCFEKIPKKPNEEFTPGELA